MRPRSEMTPRSQELSWFQDLQPIRAGSSLGLGRGEEGLPKRRTPTGYPGRTLERERVVLTWPRASLREPWQLWVKVLTRPRRSPQPWRRLAMRARSPGGRRRL